MNMIMLYTIIYLWTSNCHPTWTHYTDSEPTRLCSFFFKRCVLNLTDPTGARTHEHSHANLYAAV